MKNILGFSPKYLPFYVTAFTHRSCNDHLDANNERLEFLGDAFIGSIIGAYLFKKYPNRDEGFLTEMRSKIVSRQSLNEIALKMGIQKLIRFNKHDKMLRRSNIFGNSLEALVGAIYLDKGFDKTEKFILKNLLYNYVDIDDLESTDFNFKNKLYNWAQINNKVVDFVTLGESNEAGRRVFTVGIEIDGDIFIQATGYNKKQAGQTAAQKALEQLDAFVD
ncbi:ribonuclease III [Taibaiella sp. KBW10]|uniref:ribonuclease III n=1 Tax=Taibaiella sp. KBW10 TaxID=2153357 RepID=UPI001F478A19|nr:ribonuclease III [Taibaiella sp. KBW10]